MYPRGMPKTLARFGFVRAAHIKVMAYDTRTGTTTMRAWTPKAIPFGLLIGLLGAWVIVAALIGPVFNFGFFNDHTWSFTKEQWVLQLIPGIVAVVGGLLLMAPSAGSGSFGALLAFLAGAWLLVGPVLYPVWFNGGGVHTFGTEGMKALRWIGHFYGPGGLILYFSGYAHGLFSRRTVVQDTTVAEPAPATRTRTVAPDA
jgi:hypothetical protein